MLLVIYSLSCVFLPCIIYQIIVIKTNKPHKHLRFHLICVYLFLFYIYLVFVVTDIGCIWDIGYYENIIRIEEINVIPFSSDGVMTYILNIIMFMPLGIFLPLIWKNLRNPGKIVLIGFLLSLSIELCQLFNRRNSDIDDLMMNTLGSLTGYFLWKISGKFLNRANENAIELAKNEPYMYLLLPLASYFLLYNWRLAV